ncbi:MAG: ATP-grasp domain-containing protein [Dehalococcoidales bacterium]|nr:ATP-grasp domain-containing protein [Dehalococcoidales bacterium]
MIILDEPYVSDYLLKYIHMNNIPVLKNDYSVLHNRGFDLNYISTEEAVDGYNSGERVYTVSEHTFDWIYKNLPGSELVEKIGICKDKARFRTLISGLYPDLFFEEITFERLKDLDYANLPYPVILKPSVGFHSMGVYALFDQNDFKNALSDLASITKNRMDLFPESVIGTKFILEQYIQGEEFAIDAYFDKNGTPVILNILKHRFSSKSDVHDRIYYTTTEIISRYLNPFTKFLERINSKLNITDFPVHIEARITENNIVPIEFNPLRFAGACCTDIAYYAYGINTVDCYLNQTKPDFNDILHRNSDKIYSLILVDKNGKDIDNDRFDYNRLYNDFEHILSLRKIDNTAMGLFAILFTETSKGNEAELDKALVADYSGYIF